MWFLQKWRTTRGNMEEEEQPFQPNSHHPDSLIHDDDDNQLVQVLAQEIQNLILSCKGEEHSVAIIEEEDQVKQAEDEAVERHRLVKPLEVDPNEVRVLDEGETDETEIICENNEIGDYESYNNEEIRVEDVQDLENERLNVGGDDGKSKGYHYPLRLDAEDCAYYIRTGMCKFGSNCKFNHPIRRKNQAKETKKQKEENGQTERKPAKEPKKQKEENLERQGQTERRPIKEAKKQKEENVERQGQTECRYYTSLVGCKLGKACKFSHGIRKTVKTPVAEYNFVGLPIRPGEKECPYYMRKGSCKYGPSCRFNHPDPTAAGGSDSPTTVPLQPTPQPNIPNIPSWSTPRPPPVMYPPAQTMAPPNPDWNVYQAPAPAPVPAHLYPSSEQGLPIPPAFFLNNPPSNNTNMYTHQQQQQQQPPPMLVSEYPERPGQPDCGHFMKTGVCKYRASCKYNHPPSRPTRTSKDQNICAYFSRHGTCKFGSGCKYDHPVNHNSNSNVAGEGYNGSNGPWSVFQQSG